MKADNQGRVGRLGLLTKSMYTFFSGWRDNSFYPSEISSLTRFWAFLEFKPTNFFCSNLDPLDVKSVDESTHPLGSGKAGGTGEGATPPPSDCRGSNYYTEFRDYPIKTEAGLAASPIHTTDCLNSLAFKRQPNYESLAATSVSPWSTISKEQYQHIKRRALWNSVDFSGSLRR